MLAFPTPNQDHRELDAFRKRNPPGSFGPSKTPPNPVDVMHAIGVPQ